MPQVARTLLALLLLANAALPVVAQSFQPPEDIPRVAPCLPSNPKERDQRARPCTNMCWACCVSAKIA